MAISKSRVSVYTNNYKSEHGVNPKGYGYWFFICKNGSLKSEFEFTGMYAEAKKKAIEYAAENGYFIVSLQS